MAMRHRLLIILQRAPRLTMAPMALRHRLLVRYREAPKLGTRQAPDRRIRQ